MERYFILKNLETLEVYCAPNGTQPENSLPFFANNFVKACFDVYPNPTTVIEGATTEEIDFYNNEILLQKKKEAHDLLKETDWYIIRFQETGKPIPQEILDLREQIRNSY
jgi:hypothetical protein